MIELLGLIIPTKHQLTIPNKSMCSNSNLLLNVEGDLKERGGFGYGGFPLTTWLKPVNETIDTKYYIC